MPAPITETLAIFESESAPSAFSSFDKSFNIFSTLDFCSRGAVKLISVFESFDTFCTIISTTTPFSDKGPNTFPAIPG